MTGADRDFRDWTCDDQLEGVRCFALATWIHERREGPTTELRTVITAHVCHDHLPIKAVREHSGAVLERLLKGEAP